VPTSWGGFPSFSPTSSMGSQPIVTPSSASTAWRERVCPNPPERREPGARRGSMDEDATPCNSQLRTSWGGFPSLSPTSSMGSQPIATPSNASTGWRRTVCPNPPERREPGARRGSFDQTPMASPTPTGLVTPANIWPSSHHRFSIDSGTPSSIASSISIASTTPCEAGRRNSAPVVPVHVQPPTNTGITMSLFGCQASPVSSLGSLADWLSPVPAGGLKASPVSSIGSNMDSLGGDAADFGLPSRQFSKMSIISNASLNNAHVDITPQGSASNTPSGSMRSSFDGSNKDAGETGTSSASQAFFFAPMPDGGPSMHMRHLGC